MCGIAGFYSVSNRFSNDDLKRMTSALQHRGPDAEGFYSDSICSLGHRRLSIIDLDSRSNQPMLSHSGRYIMVYNGEVYNYKEVAEQLNLIALKTTSDSEIILEAFVRKGKDAFQLFNGMFAIAIYDKQTQQLIIARDRIGIKPLYYYYDGKDFAFASELKSLMKLNIEKEINQQSINYFLQLGYIPAPHSIYKNIFKLHSGHYISITANSIDKKKYWSAGEKILSETQNDEQISKKQLEDLLLSSVEWQLRSDVPVGVFLSGGIDSSLVAALTKKVSLQKVNSYSIGFEESSHDESPYAQKVANILETDHHQFKVTYKDALELIEHIPSVYDEPFGDPSAIPTMLVSKFAAQHVKVVLSGDGGDELFFGYGAYKWAERLNNPFIKLFHNQVSSVMSFMPNRYKRVARLLKYEGSYPQPHHIFSQEQYMFNGNETDALILNGKTQLNFESVISTNRILTHAEKQDLFDLRYYLQDDLLVKVDRASMQYSLEVRVPLLDHRLIEFAINLSPALKIRNGESKYLLKQLLYDYLPKDLFQRPKQGFAIPVARWLKHELRPLLEDVLSKNNIEKYGLLNYREIEKIKQEFYAGHDYHYNRVWQLLILNLWIKQNQ